MGAEGGSLRTASMLRSSVIVLALAAAPATAQTPPVDAAESASQTGGLEDIVVTAEKRSESLQKTALAISAVSADTIRDRAIASAFDLTGIAPNLTTTTGPNSTTHLIIHIRGVGESEPVLTSDSPTSVYVDGVVMGRSTGSILDVVDLERIEVLRGPQGTLYGRNTTGGAVNFITKKPADAFGFEMGGSYGNFDAIQARVSMDTGELYGSGFRGKLTYLHKQRDGYVDSLRQPDHRDPGAYNIEAFRGALSWDKDVGFRAWYAFDYSTSRSTTPASQLTATRPDVLAYFNQSPAVGGTSLIGPSRTRLDTIRSEGSYSFDKSYAHSLTLEADLGEDLLLRSITGFRKWRNTTLETDIDGNAGLKGLVVSPGTPGIRDVSLFGADRFARQRQLSQELNLIGSIGTAVDFVLGGFYFKEKASEYNPQHYTFVRRISPTTVAGINLTNQLDYTHHNESKALFGQVTYHLTDRLSLIGGMRYTWDNKRLEQRGPAQLARTLKNDWSKFNYAATLQFQATPDVMAYARIASGYKAGGFNARSVNDGYDPETVTNYEIGVKTQLFDRRLRLNGTLFYATLKDKQLNQFVAGSNGASSITVNAGSADFKGIELEMEAIPVDGLRINAAFGYVDPKFKTFIVLDPATNMNVDVADQARFSYSAKTTASGGIQYSFGEIAGGDLSARLDLTYRSKIHMNVVPLFAPFDDDIASNGYLLLDGRIQLADFDLGGNQMTVALWGKNLTDKTYRVSGIDFGSLGFATNTYGVPRTYGIDLRFRY